MASLVVGDIRSRTLEHQPVGRDIYCLGLRLSGERGRKPSKIVFSSGVVVSGGYC